MKSTIWPKHYIAVKKLLLEINDVYNKFITIYSEHSELINNDHFKEIKFYKKGGWNKNYDKDVEEYKQWSFAWYYVLHYLVILLNCLIEMLNKIFKDRKIPELYKNKYLIEETLGLYNEEYLLKLKIKRKFKKKTNGA
jgi:hypothetical protein